MGRKKLTKETFTEKSRKIHGNKYDYSKVEYVNNHTKVYIICPEHGEFLMRPNDHLNGQGCPKCGNINKKAKQLFSVNDFVKKAREIHGNKYDYSKVEYDGMNKLVCITCPEHGEFWQTPANHLRGEKCLKCSILERSSKRKYTREEFIEKAREIHGNYYDYSKVDYINSSTKVCIICPEHGEFWQTPNKHLNGQGCFECSKIMNSNESRLFRLLENRYKNVVRQYYNREFFGRKTIDIFLPNYNVGIEYQGGQHFKPIKMFGGYSGFLELSKRDIEKYKECKDNGIKLFYFTFDRKTIPDNYIDNVYYSFDSLCNEIDIYIKNKEDGL